MPTGLQIVLILLHVSGAATGDLMVAHGMRQRPAALGWVIAGTAILACAFGLFALLLHYLPLSIVAPAGASSYLLITLLSRLVLRERVPVMRWLGVWILALGVLLVLGTSGAKGVR